ncbi:MAG: SLC26A/SulP transporter family protein [Fimbriimonadales bacterium]
MIVSPWVLDLKQDGLGGTVSALVSIPLGVGFGMFAFSALGDEYIAVGAVAGLYTALCVGLASVLLGDRTKTIYAPRITSTFFIGLLLGQMVHSLPATLKSTDPAAILSVLFLTILLAGVFQFLLGLTRLGTLIRFTPHPVMAGFQNAAAILLFLVQLGNVIGFDRNTPFTAVLPHLGSAKPLNILLAAVVCLAVWKGRRLLPPVPPILVGMAVGLIGYYGLSWLGLAESLGPVIGPVSPKTTYQPLLQDFSLLRLASDVATVAPTILAGSVALAVVASIDALLCARLVTQSGEPRVDGNRLLVRLGIANVIAASCGGITGGLNIGATLTNRAFGARTPLSVLVNAGVIFGMLLLPVPIIALLPRVVLSAIIMVVAVQHLDPWTVRMVGRLPSASARQRRIISFELLVVVLVAGLSVAVDIVLAVFIGAALAMVLFVARMSRSSIRRMYRCDLIHSRKLRPAHEMETIESKGRAILVMELDGALFFGSAERLADDVAVEMQPDTKCLILDLRRINEIDSTGAQTLAAIESMLARRGTRFALAVSPASETAARLADLALPGAVAAASRFEDVDRAIEWGEDQLLQDELDNRSQGTEVELADVGALGTFDEEDIATIKSFLHRTTYVSGSVIFREGDPGNELFVLTGGTASAYLRQADSGTIRLATFSPGTVFGELAILDAGPRSATVVADTDLVAYVLTTTEFARMSAAIPAVAIKLLANLARELSGRLRRANQTIHQLEV